MDGIWRFQYIRGDIRYASSEEQKYDADLLREWLNATNAKLDIEAITASYFKAQFTDNGSAYCVSLYVCDNDEVETAGKAAFVEWASERGRAADWSEASSSRDWGKPQDPSGSKDPATTS